MCVLLMLRLRIPVYGTLLRYYESYEPSYYNNQYDAVKYERKGIGHVFYDSYVIGVVENDWRFCWNVSTDL